MRVVLGCSKLRRAAVFRRSIDQGGAGGVAAEDSVLSARPVLHPGGLTDMGCPACLALRAA